MRGKLFRGNCLRIGMLWGCTVACTPLLDSVDAELIGPPEETPAGHAALLKANPVSSKAQFGFSVATDDKSLVVVAPFEDVVRDGQTLSAAGVTYVFDAKDTDEAPLRLLLPGAAPDDGRQTFRWAQDILTGAPDVSGLVPALSDDALVVGSPVRRCEDTTPENSCPDSGAVFSYPRAGLGEDTVPQHILPPHPEPGGAFGFSVAVGGEWLAVGAPGQTVAEKKNAGAVYLYRWVDGRFTEPAVEIVDPAGGSDLFGASVAIDSEQLVVGAPLTLHGDVADVGVVYVYQRNDTGWAVGNPRILSSAAYTEAPDARFGFSVKLQGNTIAVGAFGAPGCHAADKPPGAVFMSERVDDEWTVVQRLCPRPYGRDGDWFGFSLGVSGNQLVVGAPFDDMSASNDTSGRGMAFAGAAYSFERNSAGDWRERYYMKAPDAHVGDVFGSSIALVGDHLLVGAPQESSDARNAPPSDTSAPFSGAAYLVDLSNE